MPGEEDKCCCRAQKTLFAILKVILGLLFLVLGGWAFLGWWDACLVVFKGCAGLFFIFIGAVVLIMAKE
ncbi:MAG: hypothetical protein PHO34_03985 [Candidatus Omnitrophica bacterium]|nr:hypothetical protein [Candidatus Omnitrophota bacterium]MDD5042220.1 hypothetical protein [Candidatus Omnitrophota bacterium]MDD5500075.1 hypothetical protein [Candidatus Omnitrophota bacterium]